MKKMLRTVRKLSMAPADAVLIALSIYLAFYLRFDGEIPAQYMQMYKASLPFATACFIASFYMAGMYSRLWKYAGSRDVLCILRGVLLACAVLGFAFYFYDPFHYPRSVTIMSGIFIVGAVGFSRLGLRGLVRLNAGTFAANGAKTNLLIVGAGDAGAAILREIRTGGNGKYHPVGFIDDNPLKKNMVVQGCPVLGDRYDIPRIVNEKKVEEVIIAIPSSSQKNIQEILKICGRANVRVKILPGLDELIDGKVSISRIRDVQIEDLLGRDEVELDLGEIAGYLEGKTVLVTGAGGSIGSELCRQVMGYRPKRLVMLDFSENSLFELENELARRYGSGFTAVVANIQDFRRIDRVFAQCRPEVVFHAAAHKHVPLMEENPSEAVKNNIFGTKNVAEAALRHGAEKFVLISTDKAVNPTSVMGATKRVAEKIIQRYSEYGKTAFLAVRFGNVLGSRGSVVPLFKKQIAEGGPVTVTHPEMTRYFMTIPEAVRLVIQAGAMGRGGEVFVLDMGKPVKIADLAVELIRLSGLRPMEDIEIKYTGIRPGEKLFEELLTAEEGTRATRHRKIFEANLERVDAFELERGLRELSALLDAGDDGEKLRRKLGEIVKNYRQFSLPENAQQKAANPKATGESSLRAAEL